jgi:hypothetical protein
MNDDSLALLDQADRTIALGDHDQGSVLLWKAAEHAMSSLAEHHGRPHSDEEDLMRFAKWLDQKHDRGVENWHLLGYFAAGSFRDNARWHYEDWEEMRHSVPDIRVFVSTLRGYLETAG